MTTASMKLPSLAARLGALRSRHEDLKDAISTEQKRPMPSAFKLQSLKRLKLRVKDEIEALRMRLAA